MGLCAQSLNHGQFLGTAWTVAHQTPLSMECSSQEYWSGLPLPSPGDLLDPGIEPASPALAGKFFTTRHLGSPVDGFAEPQKQALEWYAMEWNTGWVAPGGN